MLKVEYILFSGLSIVFVISCLKLNHDVYCFWLNVRILFHIFSQGEEFANFVSFKFIEGYLKIILLNYEYESKNLELLTEVYLVFCQTFMIEFFGEKSEMLLTVNYFPKKVLS